MGEFLFYWLCNIVFLNSRFCFSNLVIVLFLEMYELTIYCAFQKVPHSELLKNMFIGDLLFYL